jgi:hypothetical protein
MTIMGPILDMIVVSCAVVGTSCEELGRRVNMGLLRCFTAPIRAHHFASSIVTPSGYKADGHPCTHLRPLAKTPVASSPPSLAQKESDREI